MMAISNILNVIRQSSRTIFIRSASTSSCKVVLTDNESTFVAWHPQQDFPYEYTKPLPEEKIEDTDTVLKCKFSAEMMNILDKKHPDLARLELMKLTHTTKHRWFPKSRTFKNKKNPIERPYL